LPGRNKPAFRLQTGCTGYQPKHERLIFPALFPNQKISGNDTLRKPFGWPTGKKSRGRTGQKQQWKRRMKTKISGFSWLLFVKYLLKALFVFKQ
jgi:hypothetical protein